MAFFQILLATFLAVASAQVYHAGLPYPYATGYPVAYGAAPLAAAAPVAYSIPAPAPVNYALPPAREVQEAPLVSQSVEKVEQHGYSIRY